MKRILITGANSYIGVSFEQHLKQWPGEYMVDTVDMRDESWRKKDFSKYDSVFHVAGLAHLNMRNITRQQEALYYKVNTDIAIETAQKAKCEGVRQFIFMSSASVYGDGNSIGERKIIKKDTPLSPANVYGDSKAKAEAGILPLDKTDFKIVILRPPMIYGKNCKGNYQALRKIALKVPFFPYIQNERSMIYIENLCEFVRLMIDNEENGIFYPQNKEYTNTSELVQCIAKEHGRSIKLVKGFSGILKFIARRNEQVNKAFGNWTYEAQMSCYKEPYCLYDLKTSVEKTEC